MSFSLQLETSPAFATAFFSHHDNFLLFFTQFDSATGSFVAGNVGFDFNKYNVSGLFCCGWI